MSAASSFSGLPRCPYPSSATTLAPGTFAPSQAPWAAGTSTSWTPYLTWTGTGDLVQVEAPRPYEGKVVVDPAPDAAVDQLLDAVPDLLRQVRTRQRGPVLVGERPLLAEDVRRVLGHPHPHGGKLPLELRHECRLALHGPAELPDVQRIHAREPVDPRRVERDDAHVAPGALDPVRQSGGHGQRVRTATRATSDRERVDAEGVGDREDVADTIHDRATGQPVRAPVAGTVVGDRPHAGGDVHRLVGVPVEPPPRRAVHPEHREPVAVTPFGDAQRAAVGRLDDAAGGGHEVTLDVLPRPTPARRRRAEVGSRSSSG